jgi:uncharacterized protein YjbI with pentapeptide repeats
VLVIAFSVFSGFLFLNPSPSYAYIRDLSGANLSGANLSRANLSRANLSRANLSRANLSRANLSRANLSRAIADSETIFPDGFDAVEEGVRFQN